MAIITDLVRDPLLDLDPWVGQRQCDFRFVLSDAVTGEALGEIHPLRNQPATLSHDTSRTIKRQLQFQLGVEDMAAINPISDRVEPFMYFPNGAEYPLGKYMFSTVTATRYTSGRLGAAVLTDEMFVIDQQINAGINAYGKPLSTVITETISGLGFNVNVEATGNEYQTLGSWPVGTSRGQILEALALAGDWYSPWLDFTNTLRFMRTFDPSFSVVDIDLDDGNRVQRSGITETNDLLSAPNTFIVVANVTGNTAGVNSSGVGNRNPLNQITAQQFADPVYATAHVPDSAPNSVKNRGFEITQTTQLQITSAAQALTAAQGLARRNTVGEKVTLVTPPDPRHDSYTVVKWDDKVWLELSWSMELIEGGTMSHVLRKGYTS